MTTRNNTIFSAAASAVLSVAFGLLGSEALAQRRPTNAKATPCPFTNTAPIEVSVTIGRVSIGESQFSRTDSTQLKALAESLKSCGSSTGPTNVVRYGKVYSSETQQALYSDLIRTVPLATTAMSRKVIKKSRKKTPAEATQLLTSIAKAHPSSAVVLYAEAGRRMDEVKDLDKAMSLWVQAHEAAKTRGAAQEIRIVEGQLNDARERWVNQGISKATAVGSPQGWRTWLQDMDAAGLSSHWRVAHGQSELFRAMASEAYKKASIADDLTTWSAYLRDYSAAEGVETAAQRLFVLSNGGNPEHADTYLDRVKELPVGANGPYIEEALRASLARVDSTDVRALTDWVNEHPNASNRGEAESMVLNLILASGLEADLAKFLRQNSDWLSTASRGWEQMKARHYGGLVDPFRALAFVVAYPRHPEAKEITKKASTQLQVGVLVDRLEVKQESWSWSKDYQAPTRIKSHTDLFGDRYYTLIPGESYTRHGVKKSQFVRVRARVTNTHKQALIVQYAYRVDVCEQYDISLSGAISFFFAVGTGEIDAKGKCVGLESNTVRLKGGESRWLNTTLNLQDMRMASNDIADLSIIIREIQLAD